HFLVARWVGVGVERFSVGFGPGLLRWRGKETEYCLSVIPMGGYVKMMGEENPLEGGGGALAYDPGKAFALKPLWARFLIVFAGPGMNFVLAAVIFMLVFATVARPVWPPVIGRVAEGTPAGGAGLQRGRRPAGLHAGRADAGDPEAGGPDLRGHGRARGPHAPASGDRHRGQGEGAGRTGGRSRADRRGHRHPRCQLRSVFVAAGRLVRCDEDVGNDGDHGQRTVEDRHRGARSLEHRWPDSDRGRSRAAVA